MRKSSESRATDAARVLKSDHNQESDDAAIGASRRIDQLGRVVIPVELRRMIGIETGALVDFRFVDGRILLIKLTPECLLCGSAAELVKFGDDKHLCESCVVDVRNKESAVRLGRARGLRRAGT
jgi:transcriptional pleiotropic regulator of transition state genes